MGHETGVVWHRQSVTYHIFPSSVPFMNAFLAQDNSKCFTVLLANGYCYDLRWLSGQKVIEKLDCFTILLIWLHGLWPLKQSFMYFPPSDPLYKVWFRFVQLTKWNTLTQLLSFVFICFSDDIYMGLNFNFGNGCCIPHEKCFRKALPMKQAYGMKRDLRRHIVDQSRFNWHLVCGY